jgi:hypothetical protein
LFPFEAAIVVGATLVKAPRGKTVTSHDPKVGQASDQASDVVARPVPAA